MLLLTKQTDAGFLNVVKFVLSRKISRLSVCLESHNVIKHLKLFMIDSQLSLFLPSFPSERRESPATSHIPKPKLPVELSVNKALSACQVCLRLTDTTISIL